jgi:hypothetical protein
VGCSHPRLERPERMLDRLTPLAHFFRVLVEPALDGFENMLMLPGPKAGNRCRRCAPK